MGAELADKDKVISLSPAVLEESVDAGGERTVSLTLANRTDVPFSFTASALDVAAPSKPAQDKRLVKPGTAERGAAQWMDLPSDPIRVAPGVELSVPVTVRVPAEAAPGGAYAAVRFTGAPAASKGNVTVATSLTTMVLLTVRGRVIHDARVRVLRDRRLSWSQPLVWRVHVRNAGNVHELFGGELQAGGVLGGSVRRSLRGAILLPGSTRTFTVRVPLRSAPDLVRARVTWGVGKQGVVEDRRERRSAWSGRTIFVPSWSAGVLGGAVLLLAIWWRRRRPGASRDVVDPSPDW